METKELKIQIPEGYYIDEKASTFEKIVFKKKDTKPRSWKEYRAKVPENKLYKVWGVVEGNELAEAFLAMMQLMSLRQDWIHKWSIDNGLNEDWESDWEGNFTNNWCVIFKENKLKVDCFYTTAMALSFPTKEMATDFMNTFKDLLKVAKSLI